MADTLFVTYTERVGKGKNAQTLTTTQEVPEALGYRLLDADNSRHREATDEEIDAYKAAVKARRDGKERNVAARAAAAEKAEAEADEAKTEKPADESDTKADKKKTSKRAASKSTAKKPADNGKQHTI